jgi:hypothetical protein
MTVCFVGVDKKNNDTEKYIKKYAAVLTRSPPPGGGKTPCKVTE